MKKEYLRDKHGGKIGIVTMFGGVLRIIDIHTKGTSLVILKDKDDKFKFKYNKYYMLYKFKKREKSREADIVFCAGVKNIHDIKSNIIHSLSEYIEKDGWYSITYDDVCNLLRKNKNKLSFPMFTKLPWNII